MWEEELSVARSKGNRSCAEIVKYTNKKYHTWVCVETVHRKVKLGLAKVAPRYGCCQKSTFKPEVEAAALKKAFTTYVQLGNAERNVIPDRPKMISILKACLKYGDYDIIHYDKLYTRLTKAVSDDVQVMSDNEKVEQRRLLWTTHANINKWFDQLKIFFVEKGFAPLATKDSEVSTDGTTKETGGRPTTKLMSTSSTLSKGATSTNKSIYSATLLVVALQQGGQYLHTFN